jgi:hypothetical protein
MCWLRVIDIHRLIQDTSPVDPEASGASGDSVRRLTFSLFIVRLLVRPRLLLSIPRGIDERPRNATSPAAAVVLPPCDQAITVVTELYFERGRTLFGSASPDSPPLTPASQRRAPNRPLERVPCTQGRDFASILFCVDESAREDSEET